MDIHDTSTAAKNLFAFANNDTPLRKATNETCSNSNGDSGITTDSTDSNCTVPMPATKQQQQQQLMPLQQVPFIVWTDPDWRILHRAVKEYREESTRALQTLSSNLEQVMKSEELRGFQHTQTDQTGNGKDKDNRLLLSARLQQRLDRLADIYEADANTLQDVILQPYTFTKVLLPPPPPPVSASSVNKPTTTTATTAIPPLVRPNKQPDSADNNNTTGSSSTCLTGAYGQATQILAHLARDWSAAGHTVRQTLYPWCRDRMQVYYKDSNSNMNNDNSNNANRRILVPGAGLGRLAWELALDGWTVHALEASPVMAAAAASMLHYKNNHNNMEDTTDTIRIHPYAMDYFTNEVDGADRYESVTVPDVHPGLTTSSSSSSSSSSSNNSKNKNDNNNPHSTGAVGSLSFTVGFFGSDTATAMTAVGRSSAPTDDTTTSDSTTSGSTAPTALEQPYAAIVTCFFLDTATNVYDYLDAIAASVETGGLWINVGPLQWHGNAVVSMTVTELLSVLEHDYACWEILEWSVDSEPVPYRASDGNHADDGTEDMNGLHEQNRTGRALPGSGSRPRSTHYDGFRPLRFVARKLKQP
jgi:hypothetical protein